MDEQAAGAAPRREVERQRALVHEPRGAAAASGPGMATLIGGVLLGAFISAIFGWDLLPESARAVPSIARRLRRAEARLAEARASNTELRDQLERLREEAASITRERNEARQFAHRLQTSLKDPGPDSPGLETLGVESLLEMLRGRRWPDLETSVSTLLVSGEPGHARLLAAGHEIVREHLDLVREAGASYALLNAVARHEGETADFIDYTLNSDAFREDPIFAERVLVWAARFFANAADPSLAPHAQSTLVQSLQKRLEEGEAPLWVVLNCLDILGMEVPWDTLGRFLRSPEHEAAHGVILRYLGSRGSEEAVASLTAFIRKADGEPGWKLELALEMLASIPREDASGALRGFLRAVDPAVRRAAHFAYLGGQAESLDESLAVLLRYLNDAETPLAWKRDLLQHVRLRAPVLLRAAVESADALRDTRLREELAGRPPGGGSAESAPSR